MNKKTHLKVIALLGLLILFVLPSLGYAQQQTQSPTIRYRQTMPSDDSASRERQRLAGLQARDAIRNKEERLIHRAYLLLMRYHRAANAERVAKDKSNHQPEADVQFELRNVQTGPIEDILDEPISDVISLPKRNTLAVWPEYYYFNEEPKHVIYQVRWNEEGRSTEADRSAVGEDAKVESTVREFLASSPDFSKVQMYTSYEVTLKLAGRERNYRAMALHYTGPAAADGATIRFVDWVAGPSVLSKTLKENLPPVRSPWRTYVNSAMYRAVLRAARKAQEQNQPLIPTEGPLDYLPGDDAVPDARDEREAKSSMSASALCQFLDYTITISPGAIYASGMSLTPTTATVTVQTIPAFLSNIPVTLSLGQIDGEGGHINHAGTRPLGTLAATQGVTDGTGAFRTTYTSSIFGGEVAIIAHVPTLGPDKGDRVGVGVTLSSLGAGTYYNLVGATATHPDNHYGTTTALTNLPLIANDYKAQFYPDGANGPTPIPDADKLRYNDMSLIVGGKFDINAAWDPNDDHQEHRVGINCDVPYNNVPVDRQAAVEAIFALRHSPNFLKHFPPDAPHWHLRFQ